MYKLNPFGGVVRLSDSAFIPEAAGNRDWDEYQEWLAAGNTPEPAETLNEIKSRRKAEISAEADSRIDARYPMRQQLNMLARTLELVDKGTRVSRTPAEDAEIESRRSVWTWIGSVRAAESSAKAQVDAASTLAEVNAVVPAWPA